MACRLPVVTVGVAVAVAALPLRAQAQDVAAVYAQSAVSVVFLPADGAPPAMLQQGTKSPVLAGVLSWILPGLGSYYAGNSGHGTRHLAIEGVALGVTIWGLAESVDDIISGETDVHPALWVGVGALVVNGIWSIVVAVNDANATNAGMASLLRPGISPLLVSSPAVRDLAPQANHRVGLQVGSISF